MFDEKKSIARVCAVPLSKRLILAVVAALGFVWILLQSHRIQPVTAKYKALYSNNILDKINNSTLGVRTPSPEASMVCFSTAVANRKTV